MRNLGWLVVVGTLCVSPTARSADTADERRALDTALVLAGLYAAHLPIVLTPELHRTESAAPEAWTTFDEDGQGNRIFVYTRSRIFQCASASRRPDYQCVMRLASIIVHEAWHLKNGRDEAGAYQAQLTFLQFNDASGAETDSVRRARDHVLAGKRNPSKAASIGTPHRVR